MKRKHFSKLIFILSILLFSVCVYSQIAVKGYVYDDKRNPLPMTNLVLTNNNEERFIKGTVSNENGAFSLSLPDNAILKDNKLTVSFIGFVKREFLLDTVADIDNLIVVLSPDKISLKGVTVTAYEKIFRIKGSVLTANVENTVLSKSGRLDDLMNKIPFVTGFDNNYEVFGKGAALMYLNGQKVRESSVLKDLLSEDIKKINVITNPGPKYDSSVRAVIEIYTRPKQGDGIGGQTHSYLQHGRKLSDHENFTFKYRKNNYEFRGSISHSGTGMKLLSEENNILIAETESKTTSDFDIDYHSHYFTGTVGLNYNKGEDMNMGFTSVLNTGNFNNEINSHSLKHYSGEELSFESPTKGKSKYIPTKWLTNTYYSKKIRNTLLNVSGDFLLGTRSNNFTYTERENDVSVHTDGTMKYFMGSLIMDFSSLLKNAGKLSYGIESSYSVDKQTFSFDEDNIVTNMENSLNKRIQLLFAGYLGWDKAIGDFFTINGGLRYEFINFEFYQNDKFSEVQSRIYKDIYPTLSISATPNKEINITLGYKRTVKHPGYSKLNDNINYNNRYYYAQGNSLLKPQKSHTLSLLMSIKKIMINASYDKIYNAFTSIKSQYKEGEEVILSKLTNLPKYETLSLGLSWSGRIGIYSPSIDIYTGKQLFSYVYMGNNRFYNQPYYTIKQNHLFTLPNSLIINIGLNYKSKKHNLFTETSYQWSSSLRISKRFKKGIFVQLGMNNLFVKPLKTESRTRTNNVYSYNINDSDIRNISLLISYRFNSSREKYVNKLKSNEIDRYR